MPSIFDGVTHRSETLSLLRDLSDYLNTLEEGLGKVDEEKSRRFDLHSGNVDDESNTSWELEEHSLRFGIKFPNMLRYSFIVLLFILFEQRTRSLCKEVRDRKNSLILKLNDLNGGFVERVTLFLTKVVSLLPEDSVHWKELEILQKVRDCIVHTNGFLPDSRDRDFLAKFVTSKIGISCFDDYLTLEYEFCETMLKSVKNFFDTVYNAAHF